MSMTRKSYPSDLGDAEWAFLVPFLTLMREDAPQRTYALREVFNALLYLVKTGCQWRYLPNDFPPWYVVYQQARRWVDTGVFEEIAHELRLTIRLLEERHEEPSAVILDARTLQSTPESGERGGYDGGKKKKGSKIHIAVDTLGNLVSLAVTAANEQDRELVSTLAADVQKTTEGHVDLAYVDQGYTGQNAARQAEEHEVTLEVVKHTEAKRGFVLLPRRWVVERTFGWLGRFRRLARDYERLASTLASYHWLGFLVLLTKRIYFDSA